MSTPRRTRSIFSTRTPDAEKVTNPGLHVSLPDGYTAVSIVPSSFEFYQGGGGELGYVQHDRFLYVADDASAQAEGAARSGSCPFRLVGRLQA